MRCWRCHSPYALFCLKFKRPSQTLAFIPNDAYVCLGNVGLGDIATYFDRLFSLATSYFEDLGVIVLLGSPENATLPYQIMQLRTGYELDVAQGHRCYYLPCVCSRLLLSMDWDADMLSIKNLKFGHGSHIVVAENTALAVVFMGNRPIWIWQIYV